MTHRAPDSLRRQAVRAAGLGMFLDGFDISIMAIALLPLRGDWHLGPGAIGNLMASALIGSFVGALIGGPLVDRFGRRALLLPNVVLYALGAGASAASLGLLSLWFGRFCVGLAVGMDYPLVATVVAEYSGDQRRGHGFGWINFAWYAGALGSTLIGLALLPLGALSWRFMLGAAILPALVLLWLRRQIPESPRWLMRRGDETAAQEAIARLHPDWAPAQRAHALDGYRGTRQPLSVLLHGRWRKRLVLSLIPWFCLDVVGLGIGLYFPVVLRMQGLVHDNVAASAINAAFLVLSAAGIALAITRLDRWGRIPLQITGFVAMTLGLLVFAWGLVGHAPSWVFAGAAIYSLGTGVGPGVTAMALAVEIFPTELRASAGGLATAFSRLGAVLSALVFPRLQASLGLASVLILMGGVTLVGAWITFLYPLEPARLSLEALEDPGAHGL